jgi:hypothetical protein
VPPRGKVLSSSPLKSSLGWPCLIRLLRKQDALPPNVRVMAISGIQLLLNYEAIRFAPQN